MNPADPRLRKPMPLGDLTWQERGLCYGADPEIFYPDKGKCARRAKAVCYACPVRVPCLEYALANDEKFGIWGGLSERERRDVKRKRRKAA